MSQSLWYQISDLGGQAENTPGLLDFWPSQVNCEFLHSEVSAQFSPCWQPRLGLIPLSPLLLEPHSQLFPEGKVAEISW